MKTKHDKFDTLTAGKGFNLSEWQSRCKREVKYYKDQASEYGDAYDKQEHRFWLEMVNVAKMWKVEGRAINTLPLRGECSKAV